MESEISDWNSQQQFHGGNAEISQLNVHVLAGSKMIKENLQKLAKDMQNQFNAVRIQVADKGKNDGLKIFANMEANKISEIKPAKSVIWPEDKANSDLILLKGLNPNELMVVISQPNKNVKENDNSVVEKDNEFSDFGMMEIPFEIEVKVGDPFLYGFGFQLFPYDGDPKINFSLWAQRFQDTLDLLDNLNDAQKVSRLKISLIGRARSAFDGLIPVPKTVDDAIVALRGIFENAHSRTIARQALSTCKQKPGEKVLNFSSRLNEAVRSALSGENETTIQARLFDEFLDRLEPIVQFHVKAALPNNYPVAFDLAQHFEILLAEHQPVVGLAAKFEALMVNANTSKDCYYCPNESSSAYGNGYRQNCRTPSPEQRGFSRYKGKEYGRYDNREWNVQRERSETPENDD
jgi:hypothetical protein